MSAPTPLIDCDAGQYRFLPGIEPYSSGVVAMPGFEIVHAVLQTPVPWRDGFALIERRLIDVDRPRAALCAIELRSPAPFSFEGFGEFNRGYRAVLEAWGLLVLGHNPIARTNVAPVVRPPAEALLYGFSYTARSQLSGLPATFVVAGAGELRPGPMSAQAIVRRGETSTDALAEKAAFVMVEQARRLAGLGATWDDVTAVTVYTPHPIHAFLPSVLLEVMGPAARHGVQWVLSHPPIAGLEYEMDMRGVRQDIRLGR